MQYKEGEGCLSQRKPLKSGSTLLFWPEFSHPNGENFWAGVKPALYMCRIDDIQCLLHAIRLYECWCITLILLIRAIQYLIFHQQAKLYLQFSGVREIFSHSFLSRLHFTVPLSVHHLCANPVWTAKEIITWVVWLIAVNWLWSVEKTIWWGADCRIGCHSANLWSTELVSWARTLWTLWGCGPEVPGVGCQWGDFHSADVWWSHGMGLTGAQGWRDPLSIWLGRVMGPQPATQILLQCNMGCSEVLDQTQTVQMVGRCLSGHALHRASHHPCSLFFSNPTHWLSLSRPFSSPQFIFFFFHSFSWSLSGMNRIASV